MRKSGDSMGKKISLGNEIKIQDNDKVEDSYTKTDENRNPNKIENIELYDLTKRPKITNRLTYKK